MLARAWQSAATLFILSHTHKHKHAHTHSLYIIIHIHKTAGYTSTSPYVLSVNLQSFYVTYREEKEEDWSTVAKVTAKVHSAIEWLNVFVSPIFSVPLMALQPN